MHCALYLTDILLSKWRYYEYHWPTSAAEQRTMFVSGGILLLVFIGIFSWLGYKLYLINKREQEIKFFIKMAKEKDSFWDEEAMIKTAKEIFIWVHQAWSKNNFKVIAPLLTDQLKKEWVEVWEGMKQMNYVYYCSITVIHEVMIVGAEDYEDNNKDSFTIEISANVRRYIYHKPTLTIEPNHTHEMQYVTDVYTFIRSENTWKLNEIKNNEGFTNLSKYKIMKE